MARCTPGSYPDTFDARLRRVRCAPGGVGQFTESDLPLRYSEPLLSALSDMGLLDSACKLAWKAGDGGTPTIGPALTTTGVPVPGQPTGLVDANGAAITAESHTGASYRRSATPLDPAAGEDAVFVVVGYLPRVAAGGRFLSTRSSLGPQGMLIQNSSTGVVNAYVQTAAGAGSSSVAAGAVTQSSLFLAVAIADRAADNIRIWTPVAVSAAAAFVDGAITGAGLALGADANGGSIIGVGAAILGAYVAYGAGIAPAWYADSYARCTELARRVFGTRRRAGGIATFARATAASWRGAANCHVLASAGLPRAGDGLGQLLEPVRVNKVYNSGPNPTATTGWTATAGTHSVIDDSAALATALADRWGPNVHRFQPGAGDAVLYGGAATGAGPAVHSLSLLIRGEAGGESVDVGLRDASSGAVQNAGTVVLTTAYQLVQIHGVTPADTDQRFALDCNAGDSIRFIGAQLSAGARCSSLIPNVATAASAQRNAEVLTLAEDPSDTEGRIDALVTPVGWSAAEAGTVGIDYLSGSASPSLWVETGTWRVRLDGTTNIDTGVAPADGVEHRIVRRWKTGGIQSVEVWLADARLARVESAYDGTMYSAGTWKIAPEASVRVRDVQTFRNGGG